MTCQCRLVDCNKGPTLVGGVAVGRMGTHGAGGMRELSVLSLPFSCEPKTAQNLKSV